MKNIFYEVLSNIIYYLILYIVLYIYILYSIIYCYSINFINININRIFFI